jgi:tRNA pseudouridine38-40 synthase
MAAAAALLAGRHDFRLFGERPAEQPSTLVEVERAEVAAAGSLILCRLVASHFLWKMVRRITGALVRVGAGELDLESFAALLGADPALHVHLQAAAGPGRRAPQPAEWTAPPSGLFLERVLYAGDPPLTPLVSPVVSVS